ncbi:MAG TPA: hypothetical protein VMA77_23390 [Solirubrobacteraceae bacterium]|nr:hypothetical protein [Solirubrobacteraceae bacterium]
MSSPAHRDSLSTTVRPRPSGVPSVMGPPNRAVGAPVMGALSPDPRLDVIGGPDVGPRLDAMGGPDTGRRLHLMGESDLTFVDSLFVRPRSRR